jgi:hypothetical protein
MIKVTWLNLIYSTSMSHTSRNWLSHNFPILCFSWIFTLICNGIRTVWRIMLSWSFWHSSDFLILRLDYKPILCLIWKLIFIYHSVAFLIIIARVIHVLLWVVMLRIVLIILYILHRILLCYQLFLIFISFWSLVETL